VRAGDVAADAAVPDAPMEEAFGDELEVLGDLSWL
jgi:hypothetical protein